MFGTGRITVGDLALLATQMETELKDVPEVQATVRATLVEYYKTAEGKADVADAPDWLHDKTPEEIADLLIGSIYPAKG